LTYLRRLAIDQLKIDQSFVHTIGTDEQDLIVLRTIVELGKAYDLVVVAEGIDSELKLSTLQSIGCDHAQGFLFARPVPASSLVELLADGAIATGAQLLAPPRS
jgi:EAL domain-containing protein (putative c-di-GMP-specific phosphodiesterase class I)